MNIKDITLIYCFDKAQADGIDRAFERYSVGDRDGRRFCTQEGEMVSAIQAIAMGNTGVNMTSLRLVYVLDTPESIERFTMAATVLEHVFDGGKGLYSACKCHIIWKTDDTRMSATYARVSGALDSLRQAGVLTKIMLLSQRTERGAILTGIDVENAATLSVLSACGQLDAQGTGVFVYEPRQLSILSEDIGSILESQILRQLDFLSDGQFTEDAQAAEVYRHELWHMFFDQWSGMEVDGAQLTHMNIDLQVSKLLPKGSDFCVFAPANYADIHQALDFFDQQNGARILEQVPRVLCESWKAHARDVFLRCPDLYNRDTQAFFADLVATCDPEAVFAASGEAPQDEPSPGLFANKEKFYMARLAEQATARMNHYNQNVRQPFFRQLREACREIADGLIPREIDRRDAALDDIRDHMRDGASRYVHREELERFRAVNPDIVDDICRRVRERVNRRFLRDYRYARTLTFEGGEGTQETWRGLIQSARQSVMSVLNIRNMIEQINQMDVVDITDSVIKTNGVCMPVGGRLNRTPTAGGFCMMSDEIVDQNHQNAVVRACGVPDGRFELMRGFDNVSAVLEYRLNSQSVDSAADAALPENVLPLLVTWEGDPIGHNMRPHRPRRLTVQSEPAPEVKAAAGSEGTLDWVQVTDRPDRWDFQSERWGAHAPSANVQVSIRAVAADGLSRSIRNASFNVGQGGNSFVTVRKDNLYGTCEASIVTNAVPQGKLMLQGLRIQYPYEIRRHGRPVEGIGEESMQLVRYRAVVRDPDHPGDVPMMMQNGGKLAVSYNARQNGEASPAAACVFYVGSGLRKANELEVFVPSDREDEFNLVPTTGQDLYQLIRE